MPLRFGRALSRRTVLRSGLAATGAALCPMRSSFSQARSTQGSEGRVRSADGTSIGFLRIGTGPGLVYSHGSLSNGEEWLPVAERLADRFTSYVMSRRGRGRSEAGASHSLDKECEDITAVLSAAGPSVYLLGHSYGAICALETARRTAIAKLVLYEPPLPIDPSLAAGAGIPTFRADADIYRAAIADGRRDDAMLLGFRRFIGLSEDEIAALRQTPAWDEFVAFSPTWVPELDAIATLELGVERFRQMMTPTLLLLGTRSPEHLKTATAALQRTLPDARTVRLQDQGHDAHIAVPHVVANEIARFLTGDA